MYDIVQVTLNHLNQTVGDGRPDCWNTPGIFEAECPEGYNFCYDEMEVDWLATGDQLVTMRRGCSYLPQEEKCVTSEIANVWQFKDCIQFRLQIFHTDFKYRMLDKSVFF